MTRETKVGIVVASSFVCLVGVVVASRMGRNADANASQLTQTQDIKPKDPEPQVADKHEPEKAPAGKENKKDSGALAQNHDQQNHDHTMTSPPAVPNDPPANLFPPAAPIDLNAATTGAAPALPPDQNIHGSHGKPAPLESQTATDQQIENHLREQKKKSEPTAFGPNGIGDFPVANDPPIMLQPGQDSTKPEPPPVAPVVNLPTPVAQEQSTLPTPPPPPSPPEQKPVAPKDFPPVQNSTPPERKTDLAPKQLTRPDQAPMGFDVKPPAPLSPQPAYPPTSGPLPKVNSIKPQTYTCTANDSSFDALSTRLYNSPKYARALHEFNKENPNSPPSIKQDNPRLAVGQPVFLPPNKEYLESHYPLLVASTPSPVATQQAPISISPPVAGAVGGQVASLPSIGRPAAPTTDPTRSYKVPPQGQMLAEIAQQQLGDVRRWTEIYRLNNIQHPEVPIPGGTNLLLPVAAP